METGIDDLELLPAQAQFVAATERFVAFVGGVGSGKTVAGAVKAIRYCWEHPGARGLVGAPNKTMLRDVVIPTLLELLPESVRETYKQTSGKITFPNGSELLARSLDDFEHRRGLNLAFFWLDEGIYCGYEAWRVMKARLRQRGFPHQGWLTSTPRGMDQFYLDFEAQPAADHRLIRSATRENIYLPEDYADSLGYTGVFALQELEGRFVAREGLVYRLHADHVRPAPPIEEMAEIFGGIDWGYQNPFHAVICGVKDDTVYVIAEMRSREAGLARVILPTIRSLTEQYGVQAWYAGPDRPENIAAVREMLVEAGLPCSIKAAENAVLDGIETVRGLMECVPPRLVIDPACAHVQAEMADYHYPDHTGQPGEHEGAWDEHPVQGNDHALDALRYAVHSRLGVRRRVRRGVRYLAQLRKRGGETLDQGP